MDNHDKSTISTSHRDNYGTFAAHDPFLDGCQVVHVTIGIRDNHRPRKPFQFVDVLLERIDLVLQTFCSECLHQFAHVLLLGVEKGCHSTKSINSVSKNKKRTMGSNPQTLDSWSVRTNCPSLSL